MISDILKHLNWVDILVVIIMIRVCYISLTTGFTIELFKFLGTIFSIYLSLHYYTYVSNLIRDWLSSDKEAFVFVVWVTFIILAILGYLVFALLRNLIFRFIKMEAASGLNKWGGLTVGIFRSVFLVGLITFMLLVSGGTYFNTCIKNSYLGSRFSTVAPSTYTFIWDSFASKFFSSEQFNKAVLKI